MRQVRNRAALSRLLYHWRALPALFLLPFTAAAADQPGAAEFRKEIRPILMNYCGDCHADGMKKGNVALDEFQSDAELLSKHDFWLAVLRNTRTGLMPPEKKSRPTAEEQQKLEAWIKKSVFRSNPSNPDPGRVTVRRLNRVEYKNTIRDLMGVDFNADVEFPPDDTGFGFDNIGDVLTVSPLLLEKYMGAAKTIVAEAVPTVSKVIPEKVIAGNRFRGTGAPEFRGANRAPGMLPLSYYQPASVATLVTVDTAGSYRLIVELAVKGEFEFDPGRAKVLLKADGQDLLTNVFGWYDTKTFRYEFEQQWKAGDHRLELVLDPQTPVEKRLNSLELRIVSATVRGPMEEKHWVRPKNYERFFAGAEPKNDSERRTRASDILRTFATKAFRRPADDSTVERLAAIAEKVYSQPGKSFETGVGHAIIAVLASPRFLFRLEEPHPDASAGEAFPLVDEYSLASRLSYFLWSTMPDDELIALAARGELRKNLQAQVTRMMADKRSEALVQNFIGQWLQARDIEGIDINARAILLRDSGEQREFEARRKRIQELRAIPEEDLTPEQKTELQQIFEQRRRRFNRPQIELDRDLRKAMRDETEMAFAHIVRENRSVLELIDSDYTFLNERLARHYGLTNLNITGPEMRRVTLPADSPRGGVLTHGTVLIATSNPDRTSPVKRGLFVLDNFLGTPAPPPPENVPALEVAEQELKEKEPTLRDSLMLHRESPLCASCHNRMDPIGLAFENFNALGMWRETERKQPIEAGGKLVTGESFKSVRELKRILATSRRLDYYHCLAEKFLTYALGRGVDYYDADTIDHIAGRLEREQGKFSALITGVIESAPFQKQRREANPPATASAAPGASSGEQAAANKREKTL